MSPDTVVNIVVGCIAFLSLAATFIMYFWNKKDRQVTAEKNRIYSEIEDGDRKNYQQVEDLKESTKESIVELKAMLGQQNKRVLRLEGMQVSEDKVDKMLKDRVDPVEEDLKELRVEFKEKFMQLDANVFKILDSVARMEGALGVRRAGDV